MTTTQKYLIDYVTRDVVALIAEENGVSIEEAMRRFFESPVFEKVQDIETGLYAESGAFVYEVYREGV